MCSELKDFTGLSDDEFMKRMMRTGRFHYEGEHSFWNPGSVSELAWYYATSIDYLFANAIHEVYTGVVDEVAKKEYEPVLEYSGGVGSNALAIAQRGIRVHYFGIGMAEYHFTQYRIMKHGLEDLVNFTKPFSKNTGFRFDPIGGPLPQDGSLGSILAMDVLEHIPNYHLTVHVSGSWTLIVSLISRFEPMLCSVLCSPSNFRQWSTVFGLGGSFLKVLHFQRNLLRAAKKIFVYTYMQIYQWLKPWDLL